MNSYSQKNELGVFFGNSNYIGDVGPTTYVNPFQNQTLEVQITGNQVLITENREVNTLKIRFQKLV